MPERQAIAVPSDLAENGANSAGRNGEGKFCDKNGAEQFEELRGAI